MAKQNTRKAYETLLQAVRDKPIDKTKPSRQQIVQIDDSAHYIRHLQDVAVYLDIIK